MSERTKFLLGEDDIPRARRIATDLPQAPPAVLQRATGQHDLAAPFSAASPRVAHRDAGACSSFLLGVGRRWKTRQDERWRRALLAATVGVWLAGRCGFAATHDCAYVTDYFSDDVAVINATTHTVSTTIPVGHGAAGIALTPNRKFAYVTNFSSSTVSVLDTAARAVATTIALSGCSPIDGCKPVDVAVTPNGRFAYVTNNQTRSVAVIDTEHNVVQTVVSVPAARPQGVAITPDGTLAYVSSLQTRGVGNATAYDLHVQAIDTATNQLVPEIIDFGPAAIFQFGGDVVPPPLVPRTSIVIGGGFAYISNGYANSLVIMDLATGGQTNVSLGEFLAAAPDGLALTPDGSRVLIPQTNCFPVEDCRDGGGGVSVDTASRTIAGALPAGDLPTGVAVTADGSVAYVTNFNAASVSVIDVPSLQLIRTVPVGAGPYRVVIARVDGGCPVRICVGDCSGDGVVGTDDLQTLVDVALRRHPLTACVVGDANASGEITVDDILVALNAGPSSCTDAARSLVRP